MASFDRILNFFLVRLVRWRSHKLYYCGDKFKQTRTCSHLKDVKSYNSYLEVITVSKLAPRVLHMNNQGYAVSREERRRMWVQQQERRKSIEEGHACDHKQVALAKLMGSWCILVYLWETQGQRDSCRFTENVLETHKEIEWRWLQSKRFRPWKYFSGTSIIRHQWHLLFLFSHLYLWIWRLDGTSGIHRCDITWRFFECAFQFWGIYAATEFICVMLDGHLCARSDLFFYWTKYEEVVAQLQCAAHDKTEFSIYYFFYLTDQVPQSVFAMAPSEMEFQSAHLSSSSCTPQSQPRSIYW